MQIIWAKNILCKDIMYFHTKQKKKEKENYIIQCAYKMIYYEYIIKSVL